MGVLKAVATLAVFAGLTAGPCSAAITSCTVSVTGANFGSYDVFAMSPRTATGTITYTCSGSSSSPISIALSPGGRSSYTPRSMSSGAHTLDYNVYLDAGLATIWGDGTGGTGVYTNAAPALDTPVSVTVFGSIPAGKNAFVGPYSDGIIATINF